MRQFVSQASKLHSKIKFAHIWKNQCGAYNRPSSTGWVKARLGFVCGTDDGSGINSVVFVYLKLRAKVSPWISHWALAQARKLRGDRTRQKKKNLRPRWKFDQDLIWSPVATKLRGYNSLFNWWTHWIVGTKIPHQNETKKPIVFTVFILAKTCTCH